MYQVLGLKDWASKGDLEVFNRFVPVVTKDVREGNGKRCGRETVCLRRPQPRWKWGLQGQRGCAVWTGLGNGPRYGRMIDGRLWPMTSAAGSVGRPCCHSWTGTQERTVSGTATYCISSRPTRSDPPCQERNGSSASCQLQRRVRPVLLGRTRKARVRPPCLCACIARASARQTLCAADPLQRAHHEPLYWLTYMRATGGNACRR